MIALNVNNMVNWLLKMVKMDYNACQTKSKKQLNLPLLILLRHEGNSAELTHILSCSNSSNIDLFGPN